MTDRPRTGSTLIIALGLTAVCVSLAFACVFVSRSAVDTGTYESLTRLARSTARAGTAHALAVLMDSYARSPNTPTHYRQKWQTGFKAIDSYQAGWDTQGASDDKPNGAENTPYDTNGNDVGVNQALTELYCRSGHGQYSYRRWIHTAGMISTYSLGRYIEPGDFDTDLVAKPVSFHLEHPQSAQAGSPDPAVRAGENYIPNVNRPLYLDSDFLPVTTRAAARYRTRYAVSIEDLSGHVYLNFPGAYTKPTHLPFGAGASTVTAADDLGARETDVAAAMEWQKQLTAFLAGDDWALVYDTLGLTSSAGWAPGFTGMVQTGFPMVKFSSGRPQVFTDYDHTVAPPPAGEPDGFLDAYAPPFYSMPSGTILYRATNGGRGPVLSFATYQNSRAGDWFHQLSYEYTPYGRGTKKVDTPREWDEGYTTCPWRINLPSLNPQVAVQMAYALMPVEARTYWYNVKYVSDFLGFNNDGSAKWSSPPVITTLSPGFQGEHAACRLRQSLGASVPWASWHTANPYPGITPTAPGSDWTVDLGKDIDISTQFVKPMPLVGTEGLMFQPGNWSFTLKSEMFPGGQNISLAAGANQNTANFYNISANSAYVYPDSYWFDVNVATLETFMTAMLVWHGDTGQGWKGNPTGGMPQWPAKQQLSTQPSPCANPPGAPAETVDLPAIDLDADGDTVAESPSLLDSVEKLDRLWISNMGEYWGDFSSGSRPTEPATGVYADVLTTPPFNDKPGNTQINLPRYLYAFKPSNNIKSLLNAAKIGPANAREMELVLNDHRMSLFGASPQYPDFRGVDFDDDGTVWCSGYDQGHCPADPATGKGRALDPAQGDKRFTFSGYFVLQQSHFFRAFVRGEVFDEILQRPVVQTVLESVLTIDPDGSLYDVMGHPKPAWKPDPAQCTGLEDSDVLFQRWHEVINDSTLIELEH